MTSPEEDTSASQAVYQLHLTGSGLSVEREISEAVALSILSVVMGGPAVAPRLAGPSRQSGVAHSAGASTGMSDGEFLADSGAKRYPDKIVALGVYLRNEHGQESFTREDIKEAYQRAGEAIPKNFGRDFTWAISNKWIAPVIGSSSDFRVTTTGDQAVSAKFSPEVLAKTRLPAPRKRRKKTGAQADASSGGQ